MSSTSGSQHQVEVNPPPSLLKFDTPIYVGTKPLQGSARPSVGAKQSVQAKLDDMLEAMFPPREWVEESGIWMQHVSKEPSSRPSVIALQEALDKRLRERKARETGICPVREELYGQCFDELIRHVTIDQPERGLLLMRVRDELKVSLDAYRTLYDSSVVFGVRKQLQAEQDMPELEATITELEQTKTNLERRVAELRGKLEIIEKRDAERRAADERRKKEELDFLKYQGQHLDSFLKQMNASK